MANDALRQQIYDEVVQALLACAPSPAQAAPLGAMGAFHPPNFDAWVLADIGDDEPRPTRKSAPSFLDGSVRVAQVMQASW